MAVRRLCTIGLPLCHKWGRPCQGGGNNKPVLLWPPCLQLPLVAARGYSASSSSTNTLEPGVTVSYQRGLPVITVPLPSRREMCRFTLKPVSHTVGTFVEYVQKEDRGIDRIVLETLDGIRIASSTSIETLMEEDFRLIINDVSYSVSPPETGRLSSEEMQKLSDVKAQVAKLYEVLQVGEFQVEQEKKLLMELEDIQKQLEPFETKKEKMVVNAQKRTTVLTWLGLSLMGFQFGVLARLTWWEYSWDIMEPVTYFITYGTTMLMYAYFVLTRQEYYLPAVRDREFLLSFHKRAQKEGLDVEQYNRLRNALARVQEDLRKLKDPLHASYVIRRKTDEEEENTIQAQT